MPAGRFSPKIFPGARFHRLVVMERIPGKFGEYKAMVRCKCDCGNIHDVECTRLCSNTTKSCGCLKKEKRRENGRANGTDGKGYRLVVPGAVFTRLTVIERIELDDKYTGYVVCQCDCGADTNVPIDSLVSGRAKSCGCLSSEMTAARNHENARWGGITRDPVSMLTYKTWRSLVFRIRNCRRYDGVKVCERLWSSPRGIEQTIGHRPTQPHTIDRYPVHNGNYTCGQCDECKKNGWVLNIRWATRREQSRNRGKFNVPLTAFGITMLKVDWMKASGLSWECLTARLRRGWSVERTLTTKDKSGNAYSPGSGSISV